MAVKISSLDDFLQSHVISDERVLMVSRKTKCEAYGKAGPDMESDTIDPIDLLVVEGAVDSTECTNTKSVFELGKNVVAESDDPDSFNSTL